MPAETAKKPLGAGTQRLDPGTQVLDLSSRARDRTGIGVPHLPKIALTVPDGWFNVDGWALVKGRGVSSLLLSFWDVAGVYPTPCNWLGKPLIYPGPGVDALASALAGQPLRNATAPTDVALRGFHGKYLRWSVPTDIAFDEKHRSKALFPGCAEKTFQSWTGDGWASDRFEQAPGQVDMLWILNVHGERLVVDASYLPTATAADRAELDRVVHSIRFIEPYVSARTSGNTKARLVRVTSPAPPKTPAASAGARSETWHKNSFHVTRAGVFHAHFLMPKSFQLDRFEIQILGPKHLSHCTLDYRTTTEQARTIAVPYVHFWWPEKGLPSATRTNATCHVADGRVTTAEVFLTTGPRARTIWLRHR